MVIPGLAPRVGSGALVPGSVRRAWLQGQGFGVGGVVRVPSPENSSVSLSAQSVTANGSSTITDSVVVRDQNGNVMSGVTVVRTIANIVIDPATSTIQASPAAIADDGAEASILTVTLRTAAGAGVPGVLAAEAAPTSNETATITAIDAVSDAGGSIRYSMVSTDPATHTLTSPLVTATVQVTVGDGEAPPDPGDPVFEDDFANGSKNSASGFTWTNGSGPVISVVDFDGGKALQFVYGPDAPGQDTTAEQRLSLPDMPHLCVEYRVHIPANFAHRNESPNNDKWFMAWRNPYSDVTRGTWRCGFEYQTSGALTPNSYIRAMSSRWDYNSWESSGPNYSPTGQYSPFIGGSGPVQIGEWNTIRIEMKAASAYGVADGIQRMWVNGTLFLSTTTGRFWNYDTASDPADCFLDYCYFFGAANSGFLEETLVHITDVKVYDAKPDSWVVP